MTAVHRALAAAALRGFYGSQFEVNVCLVARKVGCRVSYDINAFARASELAVRNGYFRAVERNGYGNVYRAVHVIGSGCRRQGEFRAQIDGFRGKIDCNDGLYFVLYYDYIERFVRRVAEFVLYVVIDGIRAGCGRRKFAVRKRNGCAA